MSETYYPIQLLPAEPGWRAYYRDDDGYMSDVVVMWALCRVMQLDIPNHRFVRARDRALEVHGMVNTETGLEPAANVDNFEFYWNPEKSSELPADVGGTVNVSEHCRDIAEHGSGYLPVERTPLLKGGAK